MPYTQLSPGGWPGKRYLLQAADEVVEEQELANVEKKIKTLLFAASGVTDICGTRIYAGKMPEDGALPAITFSRVSGERDWHLKGPSGLERPRVQIDCWALTYLAAKTLAEAVYTAMTGSSTFDVTGLFDQHEYEPETQYHRMINEYMIVNDET